MNKLLLFFIFTWVIILSACKPNKDKAENDSSKETPKKIENKPAILFDASKAEMSANADWVIDADVFNLGYNNSGQMVEGKSNEANPQRLPTPSQDKITKETVETYWTGALSAWAIDCVKEGFRVETLPYNGRISFGDKSNDQDLSNYKVFVMDEPNIRFSKDEKKALMDFVDAGGGLFMIADHDKSDRNRDGWDSPNIWNDFIKVKEIPFQFDLISISQTSNHFTRTTNPITDGKYGRSKEIKFSAGTQMHLYDGAEPIVVTRQSKTSKSGVMMAASRFGKGRIAALGDSSPTDDGTGDINDKLYRGYTGEVNGHHRKLLMNTIIWLAQKEK